MRGYNLHIRNLSAENLTQSIAETESNAIRERVQAIDQVRSEDGVRDVVKLFEAYILVFKIKFDSVVQKRKYIPRFFKVEMFL